MSLRYCKSIKYLFKLHSIIHNYYSFSYKMEKASSSLSTAQISDTPAPKRTRWDATPLTGRNINE